MKLSAIVLLAALAVASADVVRYDNHKVYRMLPTTEEQLNQLRELERTSAVYDFWKSPVAKHTPVDVMVPPQMEIHFHGLLKRLQISAVPYINNVQTLIDESNVKTRSDSFGWNQYYNVDKIYEWMDELVAKYPEVASTVIGGSSYEGRNIQGVKLTFKEGQKAIFLEGGIHAREWIAPATVTWMLNQILTNQDPAVRSVVEKFNWYIFPVVNPDGYHRTHTKDRNWRKTVTPYGGCMGADPNRNWDFHWMEGGADQYPCSLIYAGPEPFSEIETRSLAQYIGTIQQELVGYLAFHSFSQLLLIPYGHTYEHLDNYDELMDIGMKAANSLAKRYGTDYTVGAIPDVIYVAAGGSMDWAKGTYKIPISYTYELRDTGRHGFLLPPDQIVPTSEETFDSILTILKETLARGY